MIIKIDENKHDFSEIRDILSKNNIDFKIYDNSYWAVCKEEVEQAIDCSDNLDDVTFYDLFGDEADDVIYELTYELYQSYGARNGFQEISDVAQLIVDKKINSVNLQCLNG